jgi:hypothetical protein
MVERVHCNSCHHETKHEVVAERVQKGSEEWGEPEDPYHVSWQNRYTMLECLGCESIVLRKVSWFSEAEGEDTTYFPPRISRRMPTWSNELPPDQRRLMKEVYTALQADSATLATMGARCLVDMVMNKEVGDIGGFTQKMTEMKKRGIISERNAKILEAALNAGHAAAHRGHRPETDEVGQVMDIVENLLQTQILKIVAGKLKSSTPRRRKAKKNNKAPEPTP